MSETPRRQSALLASVGLPAEIEIPVAALADSRRRTKALVATLDSATLDWIPPGVRNSIGTLLYHIAATEMEWLCVELLEGPSFPPVVARLLPYGVRDGHGSLVPVRGESADVHVARLDETRRLLFDAIAAMDAESLRRPRATVGGTVTPAWVLQHLAQHEAEHRGQIQLLRAMATRPA